MYRGYYTKNTFEEHKRSQGFAGTIQNGTYMSVLYFISTFSFRS